MTNNQLPKTLCLTSALLMTTGLAIAPALACTIVPDNGTGTINGNLAAGATLTITGTCTEDVVITVDDVTLTTPLGAGRAILKSLKPASDRDAILVDGARRVVLQGLQVVRGAVGINVQNGASVEIRKVRILRTLDTGILVYSGSTATVDRTKVIDVDTGDPNTDSYGIVASRSAYVEVIDSEVKDVKGFGIVAAKSSHGDITGTSVTGSTLDAMFAAQTSNIEADDVTLDGNGYGAGAYHNSHLRLRDSTVQGNAGNSIDLFNGSSGYLRNTTVTADVADGAESAIVVTNSSTMRMQDTTVSMASGTIGSQTGFHHAVFLGENSNLAMREGNTLTSNSEHGHGSTLSVYRGSTARVVGGTDASESTVQFNRVLNTVPRTITPDIGAAGGNAVDVEYLSHVRFDSGHTKIEGNTELWEKSTVDFRDVNIKGSLYHFDFVSRMRFRDQGVVTGNVTLEAGTLYSFGHSVNIRTNAEIPTFDGDIDCGGSSNRPATPNFINGNGFVNCP